MQTSSYVVVVGGGVPCMLQNVEACQPGHSSDLHQSQLTVKISPPPPVLIVKPLTLGA